jgi:hypothetical protein
VRKILLKGSVITGNKQLKASVNKQQTCFLNKSHDSSVSIALGYRLDDWCSKVRFLAGAGNFSLRHSIQNSFGAHPASYPTGTRGPFPGGKAAGA